MSVVVIDDDPTGAQTLRGIPLLFGVDADLIRIHLARETPLFCVLTNSRALSVEDAISANRQIAAIVRDEGRDALVVSRGDSTLRGHLHDEVSAISAELFDREPLRIFTPAFIEAGRSTVDGVHHVETDGVKLPVGETPFASDARFAYASSDLRDYLVEVGAASSRDRVAVVSPSRFAGNADALAAAMQEADAEWVVTDATSVDDIDLIAGAIRIVRSARREVLVRCAPSLVRALAAQLSVPALTDQELGAAFPERHGHGLVVVGSHVPQTTVQLGVLHSRGGAHFVSASQEALLGASEERQALVHDIATKLANSDVVLFTPRDELRDASIGGDVARAFSDALCAVVDDVVRQQEPAWIIAKGGITSHETAARGLGIRSADVVGQLFDSKVSVVRTTASRPGSARIPYVIFPGNVGDQDALAEAVSRMRTLTGTEDKEQR